MPVHGSLHGSLDELWGVNFPVSVWLSRKGAGVWVCHGVAAASGWHWGGVGARGAAGLLVTYL